MHVSLAPQLEQEDNSRKTCDYDHANGGLHVLGNRAESLIMCDSHGTFSVTC